jgi:hypothetical protein
MSRQLSTGVQRFLGIFWEVDHLAVLKSLILLASPTGDAGCADKAAVSLVFSVALSLCSVPVVCTFDKTDRVPCRRQ